MCCYRVWKKTSIMCWCSGEKEKKKKNGTEIDLHNWQQQAQQQQQQSSVLSTQFFQKTLHLWAISSQLHWLPSNICPELYAAWDKGATYFNQILKSSYLSNSCTGSKMERNWGLRFFIIIFLGGKGGKNRLIFRHHFYPTEHNHCAARWCKGYFIYNSLVSQIATQSLERGNRGCHQTCWRGEVERVTS